MSSNWTEAAHSADYLQRMLDQAEVELLDEFDSVELPDASPAPALQKPTLTADFSNNDFPSFGESASDGSLNFSPLSSHVALSKGPQNSASLVSVPVVVVHAAPSPNQPSSPDSTSLVSTPIVPRQISPSVSEPSDVTSSDAGLHDTALEFAAFRPLPVDASLMSLPSCASTTGVSTSMAGSPPNTAALVPVTFDTQQAPSPLDVRTMEADTPLASPSSQASTPSGGLPFFSTQPSLPLPSTTDAAHRAQAAAEARASVPRESSRQPALPQVNDDLEIWSSVLKNNPNIFFASEHAPAPKQKAASRPTSRPASRPVSQPVSRSASAGVPSEVHSIDAKIVPTFTVDLAANRSPLPDSDAQTSQVPSFLSAEEAAAWKSEVLSPRMSAPLRLDEQPGYRSTSSLIASPATIGKMLNSTPSPQPATADPGQESDDEHYVGGTLSKRMHFEVDDGDRPVAQRVELKPKSGVPHYQLPRKRDTAPKNAPFVPLLKPAVKKPVSRSSSAEKTALRGIVDAIKPANMNADAEPERHISTRQLERAVMGVRPSVAESEAAKLLALPPSIASPCSRKEQLRRMPPHLAAAARELMSYRTRLGLERPVAQGTTEFDPKSEQFFQRQKHAQDRRARHTEALRQELDQRNGVNRKSASHFVPSEWHGASRLIDEPKRQKERFAAWAEQQRLAAEQHELEQCTFKPKLSTKSIQTVVRDDEDELVAMMYHLTAAERQELKIRARQLRQSDEDTEEWMIGFEEECQDTPRGTSHIKVPSLYERQLMWKQRLEMDAAAKWARQRAKEVEGCTFTPLISPSPSTATLPADASTASLNADNVFLKQLQQQYGDRSREPSRANLSLSPQKHDKRRPIWDRDREWAARRESRLEMARDVQLLVQQGNRIKDTNAAKAGKLNASDQHQLDQPLNDKTSGKSASESQQLLQSAPHTSLALLAAVVPGPVAVKKQKSHAALQMLSNTNVASPVLKSVSAIDCPAPLSIGFGSTASTNRHAPNINTKPSQEPAAVSAAIEALALQTLPESASSRKLNVTSPPKKPTESAAISDPALRQQYADIERMLNMLAQ